MRGLLIVSTIGCGGAGVAPVTLDRELEFQPVTENPFRSAELVLEANDASFALGEGFPDHFEMLRTEPVGLSCTLGTVIWTDVDVSERDVLEVDFTAIGAPSIRLLGTGTTELELEGTFTRGPNGNCISDLPPELDVRASIEVRVFEPVRMVVDRTCFEDQDPLRVATRTWLPLEGLAIENDLGDRFRPTNTGLPGPAPFPVEVRTTAGDVLPVEPARDDVFSSLPGVKAPVVPASDIVVEGPAGFRLQWDVVGPDDITADIGFTYVGGGTTSELSGGDTVDPFLDGPPAWVVPVPRDAAVQGQPLCGPVDPVWFALSTSEPDVCPVERWPSLEEVPENLRAVSPDVLTAARLADEGPCTLSVFPPGAEITFDVEEP